MFSLPHTDLVSLISSFGYIGLFLLVFSESGLFFGFFLPGDSMLFSAGLLAASGFFNIVFLITLLGIAAILGDSVGYWFGAKVGVTLFTRTDPLFFKQKYLQQVQSYYQKFGARTVVLARFIPIVRTFAPILAGVGAMPYRLFLRYNILGGILWSAGVTLLGYFLGATFPQTQNYLLPIICAIILLSLLPVLLEWHKERSHKN